MRLLKDPRAWTTIFVVVVLALILAQCGSDTTTTTTTVPTTLLPTTTTTTTTTITLAPASPATTTTTAGLVDEPEVPEIIRMALEPGFGDRASVMELQTFLTEEGFDVGPSGIDGLYGPDTEAALFAWLEKDV